MIHEWYTMVHIKIVSFLFLHFDFFFHIEHLFIKKNHHNDNHSIHAIFKRIRKNNNNNIIIADVGVWLLAIFSSRQIIQNDKSKSERKKCICK